MNQIIVPKLLTRNSLRPVVLLFFLALFHHPVPAQEVYDLGRCIQTGLEQNFSLQVVRNQEEIAVNDHTIGNAGYLPSLSLNGQYGGSMNTLDQNLRTGDNVTTPNILNTYAVAEVELGMTIFRGFEVKNTFQKLGRQSELEGLNLQMAAENLVAQIVSEYHYYIQQLILGENLNYAVSLSRERLRIDEERYLLGGASKLELLQSTVYLNADSSRLAHQWEVLRSSQIRLNELMSVENLGAELLLRDSLILINESLSYGELLEQTLAYNTSLQIASKSQLISELDYKIIRSRAYPYLNMSAGYGYANNVYEKGDLNLQNTRGLTYGLTLGLNIFDGFNVRREKENARIGIETGNIRYSEIEQQVRAELLTIFYAYENNLRLISLEEQNLEVAQENLEIALERYKLGSLSGLELREVQKSLLDAEERLISVKYQAKLAEISLLQIAGRIMEYM
jgi:outer membrane protein TolC